MYKMYVKTLFKLVNQHINNKANLVMKLETEYSICYRSINNKLMINQRFNGN